MKNSNRKLFLIAAVFAFSLKICMAQANSIPGYIGNQSFRLSDDRELSNLISASENAKTEYVRIDQSRIQLQDQVNSLSREVSNLKVEMDQLNAEIQNDKISLKQFQDKIIILNQNAEQNKDEIATTQASIDRFETLIKNKSTSYGQLKMQSAPLNVRLDQINHDLAEVTKRTQMARELLLSLNNQRENYEQQLIVEVQRINRDGANRGENDGRLDGVSRALSLGLDLGSRDGANDGFEIGTMDGQNRDFRRGSDVGDRDGSARARIDGERDGTLLGTRDGNISAANREGDLVGIGRANKSDAATVGSAQGVKAGLDRAIFQGRIDGEEKGEDETIKKFESSPLSNVILNGPFAGSFSRRSPSYPGDFNGTNFNPNVWANKEILKRAYADGYVFIYRDSTRRNYNNTIDAAYNRAYDSNYQTAYQDAFSRDYADFYNKGKTEADARAYSRDYPIIKRNFYNDFLTKFDANPNRSSSEFKSTFIDAEKSGFTRRYEEIRKSNFDKLELATFNLNIANQTEIFRQSRIGEVTKIYTENSILAFDSSEMLDGGINGIAKLDGIFQAGETTLHNVVIKNFGLVPAKNVRVILDNGQEALLPNIPAKSIAKVIGAGTSAINNLAALGSTQKVSLKIISKLTSDDAIEGIHFDNLGAGVLKSSDLKSAKIQFPFTLAGLKLETLLLKGAKNKLNLTIANISKRAYTGNLNVEILVNSQNSIITKPFSSITELGNGNSKNLVDAELIVTNDADIYRDLSFSAKLSQNGVVIGILSTDLIAMAKASYEEKGKLPVVVVNSNQNLDLLLDVLANLGGSEKVAILDLSLNELNSNILANGIVGKSAIVLDDNEARTTASLNSFFAKSKNVGFLLVNENNSAMVAAGNLPAFKDAQKLNLDKRVLFFTNPHRADGVVGVSTFTSSTKAGIDSALPLLTNLSLSATEMVAKLRTDINRNNFFTPNDTIKIFSLRAMDEILNISIAYDKSGGIFSRDKKWAEMVSNDGNLFINQMKAAASGDVKEDKLGVILSAIALKDFTSTAMSDFYEVSKKMMPKILNATNKVLSNMEDSYKKGLKDLSKDLYNKAYDKVAIQRPFYIEPKTEQN